MKMKVSYVSFKIKTRLGNDLGQVSEMFGT